MSIRRTVDLVAQTVPGFQTDSSQLVEVEAHLLPYQVDLTWL